MAALWEVSFICTRQLWQNEGKLFLKQSAGRSVCVVDPFLLSCMSSGIGSPDILWLGFMIDEKSVNVQTWHRGSSFFHPRRLSAELSHPSAELSHCTGPWNRAMQETLFLSTFKVIHLYLPVFNEETASLLTLTNNYQYIEFKVQLFFKCFSYAYFLFPHK